MTSASIAPLSRRSVESAAPSKSAAVREVSPALDVYENSDELLLLADMPGATPETIAVHLEGAVLTLQADRVVPRADALRYYRALRVPNSIDPNAITAKLENGVLHVQLKKSEAAKPRMIPIRSSA